MHVAPHFNLKAATGCGVYTMQKVDLTSTNRHFLLGLDMSATTPAFGSCKS